MDKIDLKQRFAISKSFFGNVSPSTYAFHSSQARPGSAVPCLAIPAKFISTFGVFSTENHKRFCTNVHGHLGKMAMEDFYTKYGSTRFEKVQ